MTFPILPSGMWSGQGSTSAPNANAAGTTSSAIIRPVASNLAFAYDGDTNSYADMQNGGVSMPGAGAAVGTAYQQEIVYTHSPASGAVASSFVNLVFKVRATYSLSGSKPPDVALVLTASGNYSDTTPVSSTSNPLYLINASASSINANGGKLSGVIDQTVQIVFDGLSAAKTLDANSLSLSLKWLYTIDYLNASGSGPTSAGPFSGTADFRIYDISYIYL